ncbi:MAG: glutathione S-transferase N-terminal domain-containing protein [Acetobacteraceae bacterium]|nr:glutathione S-transferase N-terminal domain-containing protein [Acetobacteraceae bacterium]
MITLHYNLSPNPMKVVLALEEMGLPYEAVPVDARKGEQFAPAFLAVNPNGKVPAIVDDGTVVFDSNAILLYLAEKTGRFLGAPGQRGELLSWLMFVATGLSPFSGQAVHFRHFAPEPKDYAMRRYAFEAERHYGVLDARLATRPFMLGAEYSIVDMGVWGWARLANFVMGDGALAKFPHVTRWFAEVNARPAAARAEALKAKHTFKAEWDADAKRAMFRFLEPVG